MPTLVRLAELCLLVKPPVVFGEALVVALVTAKAARFELFELRSFLPDLTED